MTAAHRLLPLRTLIAATLLALAALVAPAPAKAAISGCSVSSSGIAFPPYDTVTRARVDGTGTITVTCTGSGIEYLSIHLTGGNAGTCSPRQMRSGAATLNYRVFRDSARTANFCSGSNRLNIGISFATGATQTRTYTMYGRIPRNQYPPWGSYSDSLTVSLRRSGTVLASATAPISGSVPPTCSVSSGVLSFGSYAAGAAALGTATVSVNCSSGAPYQVSLGGGQNQSGATRRMAGPAGERLAYELYSDSARTAAWGDGSALGARVAGSGTGAADARIVYGRVPAGQFVAPGSYADSVLVTVDY